MEEEFLLKCDRRINGGVDRISQLPDEILFVILSFLHYKEGAATTVLSSRWLDLWRHNPYHKFDRISQLPNQIVAVILSFLSLKEAAATSVLSSRWSDAWKHTPNLDFNTSMIPTFNYNRFDDNANIFLDEWTVKFIKIVKSVIQSHKAISLKNFRLSYPMQTKCAVTKWLEFVLSRQVESLDLAFYNGNLLVLEELLRESRMHLQPQTDLIFFRSLKSLCLGCLIVSGEDIELFLRNCPLLEQLAIISSTLTSDVEVCGETLMLNRLYIYCCKGEKSIKVSAPNLTSMRYFVEVNGGVKLLLENAPKLVRAHIISFDEDNSEQHFSCLASCYFSQLQILSLKHESKMILENYFTQVPNLKTLSLCYQTFDQSLLLPVVTSIIWAYPRLEAFTLTLSDLHEECMQVAADVGRSLHEHLQVFTLKMSRRQNVTEDTAKLVMYISNNCAAPRKIIILRLYPNGNGEVDRDYLTQRLQGKVPNHIQLEFFDESDDDFVY